MTGPQSAESPRVTSFVQLWKRSGGRTSHWPYAYEKLVACYGEPQRHYHTLAHIDHCLAELAWFQGATQQSLNEAETALWFHDAVYDPQNLTPGDNERRSAEMARQTLYAAGFRPAFVRDVVEMVIASAHGVLETSATNKEATAAFLDIDLSILGAESSAFDEYERQIRREYAFAPIGLYCARRAKILTSMLQRKRLYETEAFKTKYEDAAKRNLTWSIGLLEKGKLPGG